MDLAVTAATAIVAAADATVIVDRAVRAVDATAAVVVIGIGTAPRGVKAAIVVNEALVPSAPAATTRVPRPSLPRRF